MPVLTIIDFRESESGHGSHRGPVPGPPAENLKGTCVESPGLPEKQAQGVGLFLTTDFSVIT